MVRFPVSENPVYICPMKIRTLISVVAFFVTVMSQRQALSQARPVFRVETSVYMVKSLGRDEMVSQSTTYFTESEIINVHAGGNGYAKIIDRATNAITLVDFAKGTKTTVSADEILRTVAALLARTDDKPAVVREAANPKFDSDWNEKKLKLDLKGKSLSYSAQTSLPQEVSMVNAYRQFADWSARLNATRPGGLPPTARLMLNAQLAEHGAIPTSVTLDRDDLPKILRSKHKYKTGLSKKDRGLVDKLKQQIATIPSTDFVTFRVAVKKPASTVQR